MAVSGAVANSAANGLVLRRWLPIVGFVTLDADVVRIDAVLSEHRVREADRLLFLGRPLGLGLLPNPAQSRERFVLFPPSPFHAVLGQLLHQFGLRHGHKRLGTDLRSRPCERHQLGVGARRVSADSTARS